MLDRTGKNAKIGEVELAEDIKCSAVESIVPERLERHLQLNAGQLKRYDEVRVEIYAYFESCTGKVVRPRTRDESSKAGSGYDPIDTLIKGKLTGKSKGKGRRRQAIHEQGKGSKRPKNLTEHVITLASSHTKKVIVGAMSVHPGTPKAKAKAKARTKRKNPKLRQGHLSITWSS